MFPADPAAPPQEPGGGSQPPAPASGAPASGPAGPGGAAGAPGNGWQPAGGGPPAPPAVSLPKGGAAVRDIGEKFSVSAATGTASLTIPVTTTPGRADFRLSLSLSYSSGSGNGPFGLGWKLEFPAITRKTDKRLPCYADDPDADTFILAGYEDLVPAGPSGTGPGGRRRPGAPRMAATTWSRNTGRGSRACSRGSSAGVTWPPAKRTGGRSRAPTSP